MLSFPGILITRNVLDWIQGGRASSVGLRLKFFQFLFFLGRSSK